MTRGRISRRAALGVVSAATIPPAFGHVGRAGSPPESPASPAAVPAFVVKLELAQWAAEPGPPRVIAAAVHAGVVTGPHLQGRVTTGVFECSLADSGSPVRTTLRFVVLTPAGTLVHVHDEGVVCSSLDGLDVCLSRPQLVDSAGGTVQRPVLLVARTAVAGLLAGTVELIAHEVMH